MAAKNAALASAIAQAVHDVDASLILYGLAGSELIRAGHAIGLKTGHEVFADRTYQDDGSLTPRRQPDAMIEDPQQSIQQVLRMVTEGKIATRQGKDIAVQADTLCLHGDQPGAVTFAQAIRKALQENNISVRRVGC